MNYITLRDCKDSLLDIALASSHEEETPHYLTNKQGIARLDSILNQVQANYYKNFFEKVSFLFISINRGHLFTNGNKRLVLAEKIYRQWFKVHFSKYKLSNQEFKRVCGWVMYNLNKAVALHIIMKLSGRTFFY